MGAAFRIGLPWRSQLSIGVPYVINDLRDGDTSSGLGDAGVLFSKELLQERHFASPSGLCWLDLTYQSLMLLWAYSLGSGFQGGLTASKRLDPLVAFASVSYFSSISREVAGTTVDPSDVIGTRLGASLL